METNNPWAFVNPQSLAFVKDVQTETPMTMRDYFNANLKCGEVPSDFGFMHGCGNADWRAFQPAGWPSTCWQLVCNKCGRRVAVEVLFNGEPSVAYPDGYYLKR